MPKQSSSTSLVGASGEHYVAGYLSRFELIVAIPRAGIAGCDLLVTKEFKGNAIRLQVKTGTEATRNTKWGGKIYLWSTSYKVIEQNDTRLWYTYVWLNGWPKKQNLPELFFVPSSKVIKCMKGCRDDGEKWPYFWMCADEAHQYRNESGLAMLLEDLDCRDNSQVHKT